MPHKRTKFTDDELSQVLSSAAADYLEDREKISLDDVYNIAEEAGISRRYVNRGIDKLEYQRQQKRQYLQGLQELPMQLGIGVFIAIPSGIVLWFFLWLSDVFFGWLPLNIGKSYTVHEIVQVLPPKDGNQRIDYLVYRKKNTGFVKKFRCYFPPHMDLSRVKVFTITRETNKYRLGGSKFYCKPKILTPGS